MSVLTDFVIAGREDAQRVCDSTCPSKEFSGLDAKGIDTIKLGTLYAHLTETEFDPQFIIGDDPLATGSDEGPWVMEVPPDLVQRLAALDARELAAVAAKWAKTEEFSPQYDNWPPEAVHEILVEFAKLCTKAVAARQSVLMWMCL
jgi:hypothetical protein